MLDDSKKQLKNGLDYRNLLFHTSLEPLVKEMNTVLHGKGGGRNGFAQGSVEARQEETEAFFRKG